ncbi:hypothetical protein COCCU_00450 [Corynebacterium occultum]|uniref:DUF4194 domain-containing protein n=1 Tax=Corynebacterium occultum TaxID=2675219 RepID=A0A6B8WHR0_9CORY|nr:DUF4194 domain-containing protein [Corynebacterium occultum]QGU06058.1 hypothetical protein COCCU_00450 [Corynebacterium occultum]
MSQPLWESDTGTLSFHSRRALVQLLKGPMVTAAAHPQVWRAIISDEPALRAALNNVFLDLVLDEDSGIAFSRAANGGQDAEVGGGRREAMPKVLRTESLSHTDTLIILHLRQELALAAPGERVIVDRAELREQVLLYRVDKERDETKLAKRFDAAFRRMAEYSLLSPTETDGRFEVSPALRQIFDAATVEGVRAEYERYLDSDEGAEDTEEEQ